MKKAVAVGWKLDSQYEMDEKTTEIVTFVGIDLLVSGRLWIRGERLTEIWDADEKVGDDQLGRAV